MKTKQKSAKSSTAKTKRYDGFTAEERAAMKDRVKEMKAAKDQADGESEVLAKIAGMPEPDRALGKQFHALVQASAPALAPRLYYGMPAYAKDGMALCWFKPGSKFKMRYAKFEFSDVANLDEGAIWPVGYAITKLTGADEKRLAELVKKAAK